jgi:hypothetical protein
MVSLAYLNEADGIRCRGDVDRAVYSGDYRASDIWPANGYRLMSRPTSLREKLESQKYKIGSMRLYTVIRWMQSPNRGFER